MDSILDNTRRRFQEKYNATRRKDRLKMPPWMKKSGDWLRGVYTAQSALYEDGILVLCAVVQANTSLYKWGCANCPADVVFSPDPHFENHPDALTEVALSLYRLKGKTGLPEEEQLVADHLADEKERLFYHRLPDSLGGGREIYLTTIMVHRRHLPQRRLIRSLYPLLVSPDRTDAAILLPKWYWSQDFYEREF